MKLLKIEPSTHKEKKMMAVFDKGDGRTKTTHFGAVGYPDFTTVPHDTERKERYLARHKAREDWSDPTSAGALSKFILWNKPTIAGSIRDYKKHFNL